MLIPTQLLKMLGHHQKNKLKLTQLQSTGSQLVPLQQSRIKVNVVHAGLSQQQDH